ncbi:hypothetical protein KEM55_003290 [Ascosphaera atra]|nr:hypothetical protein KEM55_003290 [Ascosphaera atra]
MMSYFSNAHDNSSSVRSSQSTLYTNGSRQGTPTTVFSDEGVNRHTAPAMPRKNSREGSFAPTSAAKQQRPSLPTYAPTSSSTIPTSAPASRPPPSVLGPNGLPPGTHSHPGSLPPAAAAQARLRSASSPDIQQLHQHGHGGYAAYQHGHPHALRPANGVHAHKMQTVDNVPVPPIPPHVAGMRAPVVGVAGAMSANSSANNSSSSLNGLAPAPGTGVSLPNGSMPPPPVPGPVRYPHPAQGPTSNLAHASYPSGEAPESGRDDTPTASTPTLPSTPGAVAPPTNGNGVAPASPKTNRTSCHGMNNASISSTASAAVKMPVQLKAKINYEDNYVTLVVPVNTTFQSLTDRVDAKLKRFTDRSIGEDTVRLKYRDEDGDYIKIDSDDAVQCAFMDWRDQHQGMLENGQIGEINLFCQPV